MIKEAEEGPVMEDEEEDEDRKNQEGVGGVKGVASELAEEGEEVTMATADPTSPGVQFDRFSVLLPTMLNRKMVDDMAVEFCMTLNTKANRKKLAWALFAVEKNRCVCVCVCVHVCACVCICMYVCVPVVMCHIRWSSESSNSVNIICVKLCQDSVQYGQKRERERGMN